MTPRANLAILPKPPKRNPDDFILPHNLEAERSCIGAALVSDTAADYIVDTLQPDAFFRRAHQHIFESIRELRRRSSSMDFVTLKDELTRHKKLDEVGGPAYISSLADGVPRATNVQHYAGILKDLQIKRALVLFANQTLDLTLAGDHRSTELLADADTRLLELQGGYLEGRMRSLQDTATERFKSLEWRHEHKGQLRGLTTGYEAINELTLGWRKGDLIIIAARPSIGKTTLAVNSAVHAAITGARVAVFSLEMRREQLEDRILSQLSGVALSRIQTGHLGSKDFAALSPALEQMNTLPIEIDDRAGQSAWDIRSACRRLKGNGGLDLVIVDYVQLMPGTLERRGATRNEEITDIATRLKNLGDEISAPVIVTSQLRRQEGRPKIEDLRESGSLEQAADVIGLLHRKDHRVSGTTEFILGKQRNGPTGTLYLTIERETTTFHNGGEAPVETPEEKADTTKQVKRRKSYAKRVAEAANS
jgi:replicative DNA helicase